ncbi:MULTISPECIES: FKBP-type peptidyl-prolyl cis-trans isomerase [unclassified Schaalia]|uniref:FKBP-type peptidyl-prolyl cis-trans isomerase n=1 Tax=unclassified Schaalia TaxID=2691889 RepID=UPI001E5D93D0|nr:MULTISPECIES: FKBP-type peptidyl-prolyl cis-trans isomerase [unclassified Schaalia]MCD4550263.1 FKBP-type peptidyl-prolyl cis-trans isomerase [Schaalia sp. lx-260]MCD4558119.1 FKBP-type peptidyl-prolyl cis-trans isomerase [Schaalia sp. lx-100]
MENLTVTGEFARKPALEFTSEEASPELLVEKLVEGNGQVVEAGDTIHCHYLGQVWNGEVFDNSYDRGQALSFQIGVGMVIRGWDEGLVGCKVGDRVLLSIPSEYGYGDRGVPQAGIKGGDTLVFVTDILGVA